MPECGGCGLALIHANDECPKCGWRPKGTRGKAVDVGTPDRCIFTHQGTRCPLPGVVSDQLRGSFEWCWLHADYDSRGHGVEQDEVFTMLASPERVQQMILQRIKGLL